MIDGRTTLCSSPPHAILTYAGELEMENSKSDELELLKTLVEQINNPSGCVLVLGPRVAVRADDANRQPLDEILARELLASMKLPRFHRACAMRRNFIVIAAAVGPHSSERPGIST